MNADQSRAAFFANLAYTPPDQRQVAINSSDYNTYQVDPHFNDDEHFVAHSGNQVYSSHRGTSNVDDVKTDLSLATGKLNETDRYKRSYTKSLSVLRKHRRKNVTEVGHSLGGTLADQISRQTGRNSIVFNQGSSPFAAKHAANDQHQHIRTSTDVVSAFSAPATQVIDAKGADHSIKGKLSRFNLATRIAGSFTGHQMNNFN
jgi:putative lipase involved disintegration of autophagic bodies